MPYSKIALFGAAAIVALQAGTAFAAEAAASANAPTGVAVTELVVTAQKREENINNVGMSIQAASGDKLQKLGVNDTSDLQKIVPGFQSTPTYYGPTSSPSAASASRTPPWPAARPSACMWTKGRCPSPRSPTAPPSTCSAWKS